MLNRKYVVPGDRPLIDIGCNYNVQKVLYFIDTEDAGSIKYGITYLYNYPGLFDNVDFCPVASPLVMSKLFGSVNEADLLHSE